MSYKVKKELRELSERIAEQRIFVIDNPPSDCLKVANAYCELSRNLEELVRLLLREQE